MKETPILFSTPMVKAILEGRKTQTRRIIKPQPIVEENGWRWHGPRPKAKMATGAIYVFGPNVSPSDPQMGLSYSCPFGFPQDILWVRETWIEGFEMEDVYFKYDEQGETIDKIWYRADNDLNTWWVDGCKVENIPWKPSIHMPKKACRLFLKITNIRVERLQNISEEDAKAEGVEKYGPFGEYKGSRHPSGGLMRYRAYGSPVRAFQDIWEDISGPDSWKENPWVWVIEFEKI